MRRCTSIFTICIALVCCLSAETLTTIALGGMGGMIGPLQYQELLNKARDNHDSRVSQLDDQKDGENVRHKKTLDSFNKRAMDPDLKQEATNSENRRHQNALVAIARALGLENTRFQLEIDSINAKFSIGGGDDGGKKKAPSTPAPAPSAQPTARHP